MVWRSKSARDQRASLPADGGATRAQSTARTSARVDGGTSTQSAPRRAAPWRPDQPSALSTRLAPRCRAYAAGEGRAGRARLARRPTRREATTIRPQHVVTSPPARESQRAQAVIEVRDLEDPPRRSRRTDHDELTVFPSQQRPRTYEDVDPAGVKKVEIAKIHDERSLARPDLHIQNVGQPASRLDVQLASNQDARRPV